jgi:MEMO1 family protein
MTSIRATAVAGHFYPADAVELRAWLESQPVTEPLEFYPPRMLLLPHAGYFYSGSLAVLGINQIPRGRYSRIILLAPPHRVHIEGVVLPAADCTAFTTPLGDIPLDLELLDYLDRRPGTQRSELAHRHEHAIEVQLPLLQHRLGDFLLTPLVIGDIPAKKLAALLRPLLNEQTLLIISSDLSHYLSYVEAQHQDAMTLTQILALEPELVPEQACGSEALNGALVLARKLGLRPRLLGQHNSGDINGEKLRVVGYAAVAFYA